MRLAVIVPRYGAGIVGGAEKEARGLAEAAVQRGWTIEVWTTCADSHYTWENVAPVGAAEIQGVRVRRFPITHWDHDRRAELEFRLSLLGALPVADQEAWLETGAHSSGLYQHVTQHAAEFDALIVMPYPMPLVHYAAYCALERTLLWPCLHNEPYAYLGVTRQLMESVRGVLFNALEERDLAVNVLKIHPQHQAVLGGGVALPSLADVAPTARRTDLLYVGRLEQGKNVPLLYQYVERYVAEGGAMRLVVIGDGPVRPPAQPAFDYRGFVSEEEKGRANAAALALCQPSVNESFSFTIMESWAQGRPVLVHGDCAVTQGHVQRSQGGLWFQSYEEFVGGFEQLAQHPDLADRLGQNGRAYVRRNYTWPAILDRFEPLVAAWRGASARTAEGAAA